MIFFYVNSYEKIPQRDCCILYSWRGGARMPLFFFQFFIGTRKIWFSLFSESFPHTWTYVPQFQKRDFRFTHLQLLSQYCTVFFITIHNALPFNTHWICETPHVAILWCYRATIAAKSWREKSKESFIFSVGNLIEIFFIFTRNIFHFKLKKKKNCKINFHKFKFHFSILLFLKSQKKTNNFTYEWSFIKSPGIFLKRSFPFNFTRTLFVCANDFICDSLEFNFAEKKLQQTINLNHSWLTFRHPRK